MTAIALPRAAAGTDRSRFAPWRVASRLARREVRRRPGRTALVALLVAIPVAAITIADIQFRSNYVSPADDFRRHWGSADLVIGQFSSPDAAKTPSNTDRLLADLPDGSRTLVRRSMWLPLTPAASSRPISTEVVDFDLVDPMVAGTIRLSDGRLPAQAGEALLSEDLAESFGVVPGDRLELSRPEMAFDIVGIGTPFGCCPGLLTPGFDWSVVKWPQISDDVLVDLPAGVPIPQWALDGQAEVRLARNYGTDNVEQALVGGWVIEVLALTVLGIIVAAAFAAGARRQLVTLGQLSAGGADQTMLRRTLALQGSWSGLVGVGVGVTLGVAGIYAAARGWLWFPLRIDPLRIVPGDLFAIGLTAIAAATVAALVPARTASKVPVLTALGGRRPVGRVPRRLVPIGLGLFAGGIFLLAASAVATRGRSDPSFLFSLVAAIGGVAILFGTCCIGPLAIAAIGPLGDRVGGTGRLAARSLARTRSRHAAVVTAVAAAGAAAIAAATMILTDAHERGRYATTNEISERAVVVTGWEQQRDPDGTAVPSIPGDTVNLPTPSFPVIPDSARAQIDPIVPGIQWEQKLTAVFDPAPIDNARDVSWTPATATFIETFGQIPVATNAYMDAVGLSAGDRRAVREVGLLVKQYGVVPAPSRVIPVRFATETGDVEVDAAMAGVDDATGDGAIIQYSDQGNYWPALITPELARRLGFQIVASGWIGTAAEPLTSDQRTAISRLILPGLDPYSDADTSVGVSVQIAYPNERFWTPRRTEAAVVGVALLFTLLIVAIGLALSAAESRDERDVLVALGARPKVLARVAGWKAALVAAAGALLAIPAGYLPIATYVHANYTSSWGPRKLVVFPWTTVLAIVVAIPIISGLVARSGSSIARRVRPVQMSSLHRD